MPKESRAIPKMCGLETEFGMIDLSSRACGAEANERFVRKIDPAWFLNLHAIPWNPKERMSWGADWTDNHSFFGSKDWCRDGNFLLPNGARLYLDGAHAEISTPLCRDPKMAVTWNRACYRIMDWLRKKHQEQYGRRYEVIRNNVAKNPWRSMTEPYKRNSFACHENYTVSRQVSDAALMARTIPWLVLRTLLIGAGKTGADHGTSAAPFQISQRADFFVCESELDTMMYRGIYNTRDVPYADRKQFRRVHVISGDTNMLEIPEYLKIGLTSIIFMMMEDGVLDDQFALINPVKEFRAISRSLDCSRRVSLQNRKETRLALDCLWDYYELFWDYLVKYHPEHTVLQDVLSYMSDILTKLFRHDYEALYGVLDWPTKFLFFSQALAKESRTWESDYATGLDYEYHDNNPESLFHREIFSGGARITTDDEITQAVGEAPPTRSRWITEIVRHYGERVFASTYWHSIFFNKDGVDGELHLYLPDPTMPWDENIAETLFSLPFDEFIKAAPKLISANIQTL